MNSALDHCMSSLYCLSPFCKLLLKWVHRNLTWWISIIRLLRESPTLTSLLISFTRSMSHLSLSVLVTDCQFWRLIRLKVPIMVLTKKWSQDCFYYCSERNNVVVLFGTLNLGISDKWIADNVAFQTRPSHGVWQPSFSNYFENSASLSEPKTWSAPINTWIKSLTDEVLRA